MLTNKGVCLPFERRTRQSWDNFAATGVISDAYTEKDNNLVIPRCFEASHVLLSAPKHALTRV